MSETIVEQEPSETAMFAALRRAIAHKEYSNGNFGPDNLAEYFLPAHFRFFLKFEKIRTNTKNKLNEFLPGLNEYMIARTAYFDQLFLDALNNKTSQIVLLGAGYDSRAYRFSEVNQGTRIFELDIAPTQNRKKKCLQKARIDIPNYVTLVPINFNTESLKEVLENVGYDNHQKTLFIWEGVSYYLEPESVKATLEFVSQSKHEENLVAFDYTISILDANINNYYGVREFSKTMREQHSGEGLLFSLQEGEIESFLAQISLKSIDHLDNEGIEKELLLQEDGSTLGHITGHFCFVLAGKI